MRGEAMRTVFFIFFVLSVFRPVMGNSPASMEELENHARAHCAHLVVAEANRAYAELKMLYNFDAFGERGPKEIIRELQRAGFFHNEGYCDLQNIDIVFSDDTFKSASAAGYAALTGPDIPAHLIVKSLKNQENTDLRIFLLWHLQRFQYEGINLTEPLIDALEKEKNADLYPVYAGILQQPHYFSGFSAKSSAKLGGALEMAFKGAESQENKGALLFLSFAFSDFRPEMVETPVIISLIDNNYPFDFILSVFKHYPLSLIEEFTVPFKEGYGDKFEVLLALFARFPESRKCMQSLAYALINRSRRHFAFFQGDIIKTWEELTGLEWQGVETPFIEWYKENRPPHREGEE
jgi:hypothetical protein